MAYSVLQISCYPNAVVCTVDSLRGAQIIARLLNDRFPEVQFSYDDWSDFGLPEAATEIRVAAAAVEVLYRMQTELEAERDINPGSLPKWLAFRFTDGVSTYLEHDWIVARCLADPSLVEVTEIYSEHPTLEEMLALFAAPLTHPRAAAAE